jgi:uncharacterized membrane protein YphA (DoxX/SURF4 family)
MTSFSALARPLLASAFIVDGVDTLKNVDEHAAKVEPLAPTLAKLGQKAPGLPTDTKTLTRLIAAVEIGAGVLLATGKQPRLAAAALALVVIPTTLVKYPVLSTTGAERSENLSGLLRHAALLGGLIFAAEDRQGQPSLGWRYGNWRERRGELDELRSAHSEELRELRGTMREKVKAAKKAA